MTPRVMFRVNGRQRQESFQDRKSAEQFCRLVNSIGAEAALKVLEARHASDASMPTLAEFTARFLDPDSGLLTGVEPGTRNGYDRAAKNSWLQILGAYPVDAITKADIGRWLAWQERQPSKRSGGVPGVMVAAKTIRNYHGLLSSVLTAAVEQKLREDNPAYKMRLTRGTKRENVFLSPDEFTTLLHFIPDYYQPLVLFMAGTGCRWGEATAVTWSKLNLQARPATVRIDRAWKKSTNGAPVLKQPKSQKSQRTVSLSNDVVAALGTPGAPDELVFQGPLSGTHLWYGRFRERVWVRSVRKAMDVALCVESGLTPLTREPTIHDLRHSHASWLIANGVPLPYIQARLGHESINTTVGVYGHLVPDAHQQMADVIGGTLAGSRSLKQIEYQSIPA